MRQSDNETPSAAPISKLDKPAVNLGIYPGTFLRDINGDKRFRKVLQNGEATIYRIAEAGETAEPRR
jgi:hypothetical protein